MVINSARNMDRRSHKERRSESDARIVAAAIELFAAQGYQGTTLIQIGKAAGYTGTLISNRFGSKEGLLRAVLAHVLNRFGEDAGFKDRGQAPDGGRAPASAADLMSDFIALYLKDVSERQSRIRALHVIMGEALGALPQIREQVVKVNRVFRDHVRDHVAYGIETGEFRRDLDPDDTAVIIVAILRGVTNQSLIEEGDLAIERIAEPVRQAILAMLMANP